MIAFVLDLCPHDKSRSIPASEVALHPSDAAEAAVQQLRVIVTELHEFDPQLLKKPSVIVLNKMDSTTNSAGVLSEFVSQTRASGSVALLPVDTPVMLTSATQQLGLEKLQSTLDEICLDELHSMTARNAVRREAHAM